MRPVFIRRPNDQEFSLPSSSTVRRRTVVQRMEFLSWLESNGLARGYADFGSGAGIATDTGFAGANTEDAKSAQFDALAGGQGLLQAFKDRIHRGLRLGARQARALDYVMDDVLFNQRGNLAGGDLRKMYYSYVVDATGFAAFRE
jgi:hypothetical protein